VHYNIHNSTSRDRQIPSILFNRICQRKGDFLFCVGLFRERKPKEFRKFNKYVNEVRMQILKFSRGCSERTAGHNNLFITIYKKCSGTDLLLLNNIKCCWDSDTYSSVWLSPEGIFLKILGIMRYWIKFWYHFLILLKYKDQFIF
jgi:hypothetical protein